MTNVSWTILGNLLNVIVWDKSLSIREGSFTKAMFWVQIQDIPLKYMEESSARKIGEKIGEVIEMDFPVMEGCVSKGLFQD